MSVCRPSRHLIASICRRKTSNSIICGRSLHTSTVLRDDKPTKSSRSSKSSKSLKPAKSTKSTKLSPSSIQSNPNVPALRPEAEIYAEHRRKERSEDIQKIRDKFQPFTEKELKALSQFYTEAQMEALKAAEQAVSTEDLAEQWAHRENEWKLNYFDDLSQIDPFADYQPELELGHAPVMKWRTERVWDEEDMTWTPQDEEMSKIPKAELMRRAKSEMEAWEKDIGLDKLDPNKPEDSKKMWEAMAMTDMPSMVGQKLEIDSLPIHETAHAAITEALHKMNINEPAPVLDARDPNYEAEKYALSSTLIEDPGDRIDTAFQQLGPFTHDNIAQMDLWELDEQHFADHEVVPRVQELAAYKGMGVTEMLYKIEKSGLDEKVKQALRPFYTYKGTLKEAYAKRILYPFVTDEKLWVSNRVEYKTVKELFEEVQTLDMPPHKKAEILAYSHWADTPKGDALRPLLERTIATYKPDPMAVKLQQLEQEKREMLGLESMHEEFPFEVEGPNKKLYGSEIYSALNPDIPRIEDPTVTYSNDEDDPMAVGLIRVSQQTGIAVDELRRFRTKNLIFHRVVNQTKKGKIQSLYALAVAGNENGLLGIGEGKAFEPEDALIKARLAALKDVAPVLRYEKRTIFGELNTRVGGCTVQLSNRPPGFGLRTQYLIYEVARCAGIRDLAARVGRSRNKMNTVKAAVKALRAQIDPEEIARSRGRKLVDVRKVYYGQTVL